MNCKLFIIFKILISSYVFYPQTESINFKAEVTAELWRKIIIGNNPEEIKQNI